MMKKRDKKLLESNFKLPIIKRECYLGISDLSIKQRRREKMKRVLRSIQELLLCVFGIVLVGSLVVAVVVKAFFAGVCWAPAISICLGIAIAGAFASYTSLSFWWRDTAIWTTIGLSLMVIPSLLVESEKLQVFVVFPLLVVGLVIWAISSWKGAHRFDEKFLVQ